MNIFRRAAGMLRTLMPIAAVGVALSCDTSGHAPLDPGTAPGEPGFLEVVPGTATIALAGQSTVLEAVVRDGRGRRLQGQIVLWETSSPQIAMVNADGSVTGLDVGTAVIRARSGMLSDSAVVTVAATPYPLAPKRIAVAPRADTIPTVGGFVELSAVAYDAQNAPIQQPSVAWFSLDPMVASVTNGRVTGTAKGAARILITNGSLSDTAVVWVQPTREVARVQVSLEADTIFAIGDTVKVTASALDASGAHIAGEVLTLAALDPAVAVIDGSNLVATGGGIARVMANYGRTTDTATVAVAPGTISEISVTPEVDTIPKVGQSIQLEAVITSKQGQTGSSSKVKWQSLDPYAIMTDPGTVAGVRQGKARIVAKIGSAADTAIIWIEPAPQASLPAAVIVQPPADTIDVIGETIQLSALVVDAQGSPVQDQSVSWNTTNPTIVQVDAQGKVKGLAKGLALVIASAGTFADTALISVAPVPVATRLRVAPGRDTIPDVGGSVTLSAEALDAEGNVLSAAAATWASLDPKIATVAAAGTPATSMLVTGTASGTARIVASYQGMADTASVLVQSSTSLPQPTAVRVTPKTDTIPSIGGTVQLTGTVRDQSGNPISGLQVAWQPLDPSIATVSGTGLVQGVASGVARIRAYYGTLADTAKIWVAPTKSGGPSTFTVPSAIDPTGKEDVTDKLLAFFASVPDGSTIAFPAGGKYRAEGTLVLMNRNDLTFEGNGATILQLTDGSGVTPPKGTGWSANWPRNRSHWAALGGSNIRWRNIILKGANPHAGLGDSAYVSPLEAQHGFDIGGVQGVEIDNATVTDIYGDFVYLGLAYGSTTWPTNVHVHHSHFERNGRQGVGIANGQDVLIEQNYIGYVRRASIDIEPNGSNGGARRVLIRNNTFGPGRLNWLASGGKGGIAEDITLENNTLDGKAAIVVVIPPAGTRRARFRIVGNVSNQSHGSNQPLMRFYRVDGLVVRDNVNPLNVGRDMTGVYVSESCNADVGNNTFLNALLEFLIEPYGECR